MAAVLRNVPVVPGRPRKYQEGYARSAKRIYLIDETFTEWRRIKEEMDLASDDAVAQYLLNCRKNLTARSAPEQDLSTDHNIFENNSENARYKGLVY